MKILIVEDEKDLRESLAEGLQLSGYAVDTCEDGAAADEMAFVGEYDLIVLDLNLPKLDGISVLKSIRQENKQVNIIILTARGSLQDKIAGFDEGANDYMTKPFHFAELLARVRSLLRRKTIQRDSILHCGNLSFDSASRIATVCNRNLCLKGKETAILEYMLLHQNRVISLEELISHIWDNSIDIFSNAVRVHMSSLRRKLKECLGYDPIENRIGEGYIIKSEDRK